ncbi:PrsW family intramembrane metalloprotease [Haloarcula nitratireducens]|uniref:PrsW family intramembrane metalloprotease n=1 Tax=Haloarcula nitratireducens TaxID=2487749 RepID=A0AAW4P713_9EURY|nr:PrsW family intramembrane metalloprotease [Halomicroarcula nitratireducens]MBX0293538.1 PrsW family intramembrane metalloprotease [Halomicroarcula nitratireducens]
MPDDETDPVAAALSGSTDLYDIADWEPRSALDGVSVSLYGLLHASRRWLLVALALLLFVAQLAATVLLAIRRPELGVLAALSAVPALAIVGYLWYGDPTHREPLEPIAITFVLSILFASIAALVNTLLNPLFQFVPVVGMVLYFFLVVGPIEETVKWLAVRVGAFGSINAVVDGVVYGAVAGLGFASIENALYISQGYTQALSAQEGVEPIVAALQTATSRAFVGPGHVLYSSFAGYYLGLAKFNSDNAGPIVVKGILIAAVIHAIYNTSVTYLPRLIPGWNLLVFVGFVIAFDAVVGYLLYRKLKRYQSHYHRATNG